MYEYYAQESYFGKTYTQTFEITINFKIHCVSGKWDHLYFIDNYFISRVSWNIWENCIHTLSAGNSKQ